MEKDVLVSFYLAVLKNQLCELQVLRLKNDDPNFVINTPEIELTRRELSLATFNLVRAALPTTLRHKRLFRTKYVDEVDLPNMENNLVSTANKVLNFTSIPALADYDLVPAQPSAQEFINTFNRVQGLVISIIETALTNSYPVSVNKKSSESISNRIEMFDQSEFVVASESSTLLDHCHLNRQVPLSDQNCTFREVVVQVKIGSIKYTSTARLPLSSSSYVSISPELFDALLELDRDAAYFEYEFVRCLSHRFRTIQEAEDLQIVTVLFSETLMWALAVKLLTVQQLAERDPCILLAIPRLAILVGCRILPDSPIGANRLATGQKLPFMFSLSRSELAYLSRQLYALRPDQLCRLARWLGPNGLPNLIHNQNSNKTNIPTVTTTATTNSSITTSPELRADRIRSIEQLEETQSQQNQNLIVSNDCSNPISQSYSPSVNYKIDLPKKIVWKSCLMGLHKLYKCISNVADCFAREFPTELRFILQKVIEIHDNSNEEAALAELEQMNNLTNISKDLNKIDLNNRTSQINDDDLNTGNNMNKVNNDIDDIENDDDDDDNNNGDLTELEEEIDLDTSLIQNEYEFKNLSNLFNWIEVMKLTNTSDNNKLNLIKMYKKSSLIFPHKQSAGLNFNLNKQNLNFDKSILIHENNSTKPDIPTTNTGIINKSTNTTTTTNLLTSSVKKCLRPINNLSKNIPMEIGIDVTNYLNESTESYSSILLSPPLSPPLSSPRPLRDNLVNSLYYEDSKNESNGFVTESNNRSALSQHLSTLNLGFSVDGNHNTNEYLFNYLPPWQPDSPILDSSSDNFKEDSDNDFDHSSITSENGEQNMFTVGKQCAACHRTFTIIRRRHHCRRCGHIFCSSCCNQWQSIDGLATNKPVRICMECYEFLNPEIKSKKNFL